MPYKVKGAIDSECRIMLIDENTVFMENSQQPSLEQSLRNRLESLGHNLHPITDCRYDNVNIKSITGASKLSPQQLAAVRLAAATLRR